MMKTVQARRRVIIVAFSLISAGTGAAMLAVLGSAVPRELSVTRLLFSEDLAAFTMTCLAQAVVGIGLTVLASRADPTARVGFVALVFMSLTSLGTIGAALFGDYPVLAMLFVLPNTMVLIALRSALTQPRP
jgi:hypothetical protein